MCTGGVAEIRAVVFFSSNYFGEISILYSVPNFQKLIHSHESGTNFNFSYISTNMQILPIFFLIEINDFLLYTLISILQINHHVATNFKFGLCILYVQRD